MLQDLCLDRTCETYRHGTRIARNRYEVNGTYSTAQAWERSRRATSGSSKIASSPMEVGGGASKNIRGVKNKLSEYTEGLQLVLAACWAEASRFQHL